MSNDSSDAPAPNRGGKFLNTLTTTLIGLLLYWLPPTAVAIWLGMALGLFGLSDEQAEAWFESAGAIFLFTLVTEVVVIAAVILLMRANGETRRNIGLVRPRPKHFAYMLAGMAVYYALYIVAAIVLQGYLDFEQKQEIGFDTNQTGIGLALAFISLVVLPPITEEILFRGFLYSRFRRALSVLWSAVFVSILFAAAHLQFGSGNALLWVAALDTFILSLVLVYLREKTGNLWAGIGIHTVKNFVAFILLFIFKVSA